MKVLLTKSPRPTVVLSWTIRTLACSIVLTGVAAVAEPPAENLALGKKCTLLPRPGYRYCTDPGDPAQLTDGKTTDEYFWTQQGTVGWQSAPYVVITVDLGRVEPIGGVSFRTAAGRAGVQWPGAIRVLVSDEGKSYRDVGDLVQLDHQLNGPWPEGYAIRRLVTSELHTRGRFARFLVLPGPGSPYTFVDEIEVFRGPQELLQRPPGGKPVGDLQELFALWRIKAAVQRRFEADIAGLKKVIEANDLPAKVSKRRLQERLAEVAKALRASEVAADRSLRAVLPLNDAHADLFKLQAKAWGWGGSLAACIPEKWDPPEPFGIPAVSRVRIDVHTMRGEYRAGALDLYNNSDRVLSAQLHFEGLAGSPMPDYLTLHDVPWTDTSQGRAVAAALPRARRGEKHWRIEVLPGLIRQVWITVHVTDLPAGEHSGVVVVQSEAADTMRIPICLHVYPLEFPKQTTLLLGGWSYTNGNGRYGITPENRRAFLEHLKRHRVNAPWATSSVMMQYEFSGDGTVRLETREFDNWIADWPQARRYHVFLSIGDYSRPGARRFAGAEIGTPEFMRRVGAWISAWVRHLKGQGIGPERLGLLLHDEPHEGTDVGPLVAWAKAIRAAEPKVWIWEDPTYRDPTGAPAELFDVCDVLCPNRPMWLAQGDPFARFYLQQKQKGRNLQFYSCSGPARLLDPYTYYRLQAWHCWQVGATGSFFWALGDNSGTSSWNPYLARSGPYTPLFLDEKTVTAGKHMEAIREGVQDYEYLVMLRKAVEKAKAAGRSDTAVREAEALLDAAAGEVLNAQGAGQLRWQDPKDRTVADQVRVRILQALTTLQNQR